MFDSSEELLRSIRLGEDSSLELKDVRFRGASVSEPGRDDLADELAAIANTRDGVVGGEFVPWCTTPLRAESLP